MILATKQRLARSCSTRLKRSLGRVHFVDPAEPLPRREVIARSCGPTQ